MSNKSPVGFAILLSTLTVLCAGAEPSAALAVGVDSSRALLDALRNPGIATIVLNGKRASYRVTRPRQ